VIAALLEFAPAGTFNDRLPAFVDSPGFAPAAFAVAFLAGAAHAVAPGHGKSLAAAYLVGSEGRARDAAYLGFSVAVMHTLSVLVIALAWTFFSLSDLVRMAELTAGLQLAAGVLVVVTGGWLLRRQFAGHDHGHDHGHGHHRHDRGPSRPGLVLLGASGGLTPSPSAFLVLLTGLFSGRAGLALALVVIFGFGMAVVLFAVGLTALCGRTLVLRAGRSHAAVRLASRLAPLVAASGITIAGCAITAVAVMNLAAIS
jgi:nickel/cobalt transporter (NicO) family protein